MTEQIVIDIARLAVSGDRDALERLLEMKYRCILMHATHILGDDQGAEDVAQEVCIAVTQNITKLKTPEAVEGWIYQIVKNCCRTHWKRTARIATYEEPKDLQLLTSLSADDARAEMNLHVVESNPDQAVLRSELAAKLRAGIRGLSKRRRNYIYLYHYGDYSYEEIAKITHTPVKTVSSNIYRARKQLSSLFSTEEIAEMGFAIKKPEQKAARNLIPTGAIAALYKQQESLLAAKKVGFSVTQAIQSSGAKGVAVALSGHHAASAAAVGLYSGLAASAAMVFTMALAPQPAPPAEKAPPASVVMPVETPVAQTVVQKPDPTPAPTPEPAPAPVSDAGTIVFSGGIAKDSALNPKAAALEGVEMEIASSSWQITGDGVQKSGDGLDPSAALAGLKAERGAGWYTLTFTIVDSYGNTVVKTRDFEIG